MVLLGDHEDPNAVSRTYTQLQTGLRRNHTVHLREFRCETELLGIVDLTSWAPMGERAIFRQEDSVLHRYY